MGSGIKSIQRGVISPTSGSTGTITISSVNTAKAVSLLTGFIIAAGVERGVTLELTNATTLTWTTWSASDSGSSRIAWQVVEFY